MNKRKMIPISKETHDKLKIYCDKHNYKISKLCEAILLKHIKSNDK